MQISPSSPPSLSTYCLSTAHQRLLTSPLIQEAKLKKIYPDTLYVDYTIRHPVMTLMDYENVGLDKDGYLIPLAPFSTSQHLPKLYLGLPPFDQQNPDWLKRCGGKWHHPICPSLQSRAVELLKLNQDLLAQSSVHVKIIDLSQALAPTLGQREIVLSIEETILWHGVELTFPRVLRMSTKNLKEQLEHFLWLKEAMWQDYQTQLPPNIQPTIFTPRVIDLRIPKVAFVENRPLS
jgi:hypothetical protein